MGTNHYWPIKWRILQRDNHTCLYCLQPASTVDHLIPLVNNGSWELSNLIAACEPCNKRKGSLPLDTFLIQESDYLLSYGQLPATIKLRILEHTNTYANEEEKIKKLNKTFRILLRDSHTCLFCLKPATTITHLSYNNKLPVRVKHYVACCSTCKEVKKDLSAKTFIERNYTYLYKRNPGYTPTDILHRLNTKQVCLDNLYANS